MSHPTSLSFSLRFIALAARVSLALIYGQRWLDLEIFGEGSIVFATMSVTLVSAVEKRARDLKETDVDEGVHLRS